MWMHLSRFDGERYQGSVEHAACDKLTDREKAFFAILDSGCEVDAHTAAREVRAKVEKAPWLLHGHEASFRPKDFVAARAAVKGMVNDHLWVQLLDTLEAEPDLWLSYD